MSRVKVGISGLSIPKLIQVCAEIVTKMTGNPNFATPVPKLADVGDAITNLSNSYQAAIYGDRTLKAKMHINEKVLHGLMMQLGAYVQTASNGDESIILTSGFGIAKKPGPEEPLPTPINLRCLHTDGETSVPMRWKKVKGSKLYFVQQTQTPDDAQSWQPAGSSTKTRFTATGLLPKTDYWFRVCATGPLGNSDWSDPAKRLLG